MILMKLRVITANFETEAKPGCSSAVALRMLPMSHTSSNDSACKDDSFIEKVS